MQGKIAKLEKINLWYETFGNPNNPSILLLMGAGAQGVSWSTNFCTNLAKNYHVIRYDHRDTGLSSNIDFTLNPYSLTDMANDAVNLLAALNITKTHLIGTSMGGFLAVLIAAHYKELVSSITLISTTYDIGAIIQDRSEYFSTLPESRKAAKDFLSTKPDNKTDPIEHMIQYLKILNGTTDTFDDNFFRRQILAMNERSKQPPNNNHILAIQNTKQLNIEKLLPKIVCPTLIMHGENDPLIPIEHGIELARKINRSHFVAIKNMGHIMDGHYDIITNHVLKHLNN